MYSYEEDVISQGYSVVAGIDEAGRGPLAGPVVAAAVILPDGDKIDGLNDSKKLTEKKRELLYSEIIERAHFGVGIIDEETIDRVNIYQATRLAMKQAVCDLSKQPVFLLLDGNMTIDLEIKQLAIVKGDSKSASIAAASIIAKVTRDRMMVEMHTKYPEYGFNKHKGYPTKAHVESIAKHGITPFHRKSFSPVSNYC